jgi:hypothetical protein
MVTPSLSTKTLLTGIRIARHSVVMGSNDCLRSAMMAIKSMEMVVPQLAKFNLLGPVINTPSLPAAISPLLWFLSQSTS